VNFGDRTVDLILQHARLVGQYDLVSAQIQEIGAASAGFVLVERLDQKVGRACLERGIADLPVVDDSDDDDRNVDAMPEAANLLHELDAHRIPEA
jgi:hypothetical protein